MEVTGVLLAEIVLAGIALAGADDTSATDRTTAFENVLLKLYTDMISIENQTATELLTKFVYHRKNIYSSRFKEFSCEFICQLYAMKGTMDGETAFAALRQHSVTGIPC